MDWRSQPTELFSNGDDFVCDIAPKDDTQHCKFWIDHDNQGGNERAPFEIDLSKDEDWDELVEVVESPRKDGYWILFIPRTADVFSTPSYFTSIPVSQANWNKVVRFLSIPKSYGDLVDMRTSLLVSISQDHEEDEDGIQMSIGTTGAETENGFAFASTYFKSRQFTCAIMVGCTDFQIEHIGRLLSSARHSSRHPLLMLGIFEELQLSRFEANLSGLQRKYLDLIETLTHELNTPEKDHSNGLESLQGAIDTHETSRVAQQDIENAKFQLEAVCIKQAEGLDQIENGSSEFTQFLLKRFNDIHFRLDNLMAQCRLLPESVSFFTGFIQSQVSIQEARISRKNANLANFIAGVALVYLPITGVATILATPIFGWTNDWKDVYLHSVVANGQSNGDATDPGSANAASAGMPVVSGYVWIWVIASIGLYIITLSSYAYIFGWEQKKWARGIWHAIRTLGGIRVGFTKLPK
ncbi:hypothetical protein O1611_g5577 [Lasiodiplodia mahajangana]|uniref:Uncharacterized protein n=1 Tax=Lasiodiplodia mahajangana TaxID=1108764 RepID=A0ACC2JKJ6_9PEZI|nr:hypothetical protein O1611_g5577 [Lasiodiplodia mahajangana]